MLSEKNPTSIASVKPIQIPIQLTGHSRPVVKTCFNKTGHPFLVSCSKDKLAIIRDGVTGDWIGNLDAHKGAIWDCVLSNDASITVTGSADFDARVWINHTGQCAATLSHKHVVRCVGLSHDERLVCTGGLEKIIRIFDLSASNQTILEYKLDHDIKSICFDSERNRIYSGNGSNLNVFDMTLNKQIESIPQTSVISSISLSPKNEIVCSAGHIVSIYSNTFKLVKKFDIGFETSSCTIHPTLPLMTVSGSLDLWLHVYDFESGQEIDVLKGHHGPVHSVCYSPDGEIFSSGSEDGTVRLWQTVPGKKYGLWSERLA